jgi:hypothetical protein
VEGVTVKKPYLLYKHEKHYLAWNINGEKLLCTTSYEMANRVLDDLGYYQVSPNSRVGTIIRQRLADKLNAH